MKKILLLLLFTVASYGQAVFDEGIQITGNANSATATKVNVQEANGKVNTQTINTGFNKNIGLGGSDVVGATTLLNQYSTTPLDWTATAFNSGQVVFYGGKQWIAKMATVAGDVPAVSSKWEEITFEALANKTVTVDQTIIDGSTNAVAGNAVFDGLALKSNIGHTHVASQITDLSKASVGLGNVDNTSDLNKPISTATQTALNGKENSFTKNTAFNKNFGTTAGTVAEGNDSRILNGQTAFGWGNHVNGGYAFTTGSNINQASFRTALGLGSNAYTSTAYLPLTGGTLSGNLNVNSILRVGDNSFNSTIDQAGIGKITSEFTSGRSYTKFYGHTGSTGNYLMLSIDGLGNSIFTGTVTATSYTGGATLTGAPTAPTAAAGTNTTQVATTAFVQANARPYKVYTALLSQIGNAAPTATVLENTLGGTVVWSRTGTGVYTATLNGVFPLGKTTVMPFFGTINGGVNLSQTISGVRIDNNSVGIRTSAGGTLTDVLLLDATIEIRVYN